MAAFSARRLPWSCVAVAGTLTKAERLPALVPGAVPPQVGQDGSVGEFREYRRCAIRLPPHANPADAPSGHYLWGVNDVEQLPVRLPDLTDTLTFTRYPGVAPLM